MHRTTLKLVLILLIPLSALFSNPEDWAEDMETFAAREARNPSPKGAVVCVGSSSMRMWDSRIAKDLDPLTVVSLGFGGSTFDDLNFYFDELVARYEPRAILLYEGDNDIGNGNTPVAVARDFLTFVEKTHAFNPAIRIYFISIKPSVRRVAFLPDAQKANSMIAALCAEDPRLEYIDVATSMLDKLGAPIPELFIEDELHLNSSGYDRWSFAIRSVIIPAERPFERK